MHASTGFNQSLLVEKSQEIYSNFLNGGIPPGLAAIASPIAARHFYCLKLAPEEAQILEKITQLLIDNVVHQVRSAA
jgi:hypothetical protein